MSALRKANGSVGLQVGGEGEKTQESKYWVAFQKKDSLLEEQWLGFSVKQFRDLSPFFATYCALCKSLILFDLHSSYL